VLHFPKASLWNWNCIWRTSWISQIQRLCRCALPSVQMNFLFQIWSSFQPVFLGKRDGMHSGTFTLALVIMAIDYMKPPKDFWTHYWHGVDPSVKWKVPADITNCVFIFDPNLAAPQPGVKNLHRETLLPAQPCESYSCSDTLMDVEVQSGFLHSYFNYKA
jgi:hypothetical protein